LSFAVLSDFDGTVVNIDTCVHVLRKFAKEDWRVYDEQFERGALTLEECLKRQFSTVTAPRSAIISEIAQAASFRDGFAELIQYCRARGVPFIIASAGLDFAIDHLLAISGLTRQVQVYAPKSEFSDTGIRLTFPSLRYEASECFKDDLVLHYTKQGRRVAYIGDGIADYAAARTAAFPFAVENSKLARLLDGHKIDHYEIRDFGDVIRTIQTIETSRAHDGSESSRASTRK
jgi:2-hydroxy-3-keto-5-methylthiopentenyl-1-phosphate phosphatase